MATHPAQNGCLCEWSGDDHYPQFVKWNPDCPKHVLNPKQERKMEIYGFLGSAEDYIYRAMEDQANTPMESIHTIYAIRDVIRYLKEQEQRVDRSIVLNRGHTWVKRGMSWIDYCKDVDCETIRIYGVVYVPEKV